MVLGEVRSFAAPARTTGKEGGGALLAVMLRSRTQPGFTNLFDYSVTIPARRKSCGSPATEPGLWKVR